MKNLTAQYIYYLSYLNVIVFITTVPITAILFLSGQLDLLRQNGYEVVLITSPGNGLDEFSKREGITVHTVPMQREVAPFRDLISLFRLFFLLLKLKPSIVNAGTPKAGLLGMIAAYLVRVPFRIYQQRGLRLETTDGLQRRILLTTEKMTAFCAHKIVCNSQSLRDVLIDLNLTSADKYTVIGHGSSNGVDITRFSPKAVEEKKQIQADLDISPSAQVVGFVGRLTRDKGIIDLISAFSALSKNQKELILLVVGPLEEGDPLPTETRQMIQNNKNIIHLGFVKDTSQIYGAMDVFAFPSYREGFPNALLEAASSGIPSVGYKVTGTVDAIVNGETGFIVQAKDRVKFADHISKLLENDALRATMSQNGRSRCEHYFDRKIVHKNWLCFYDRLLSKS